MGMGVLCSQINNETGFLYIYLGQHIYICCNIVVERGDSGAFNGMVFDDFVSDLFTLVIYSVLVHTIFIIR